MIWTDRLRGTYPSCELMGELAVPALCLPTPNTFPRCTTFVLPCSSWFISILIASETHLICIIVVQAFQFNCICDVTFLSLPPLYMHGNLVWTGLSFLNARAFSALILQGTAACWEANNPMGEVPVSAWTAGGQGSHTPLHSWEQWVIVFIVDCFLLPFVYFLFQYH